MTLLFAMWPYYLLGNLHCLGMCGPLAMMLATHRYRYFYFTGRLLSYTLAGGIAGQLGAVINLVLNQFYFSAFSSFFFGLMICMTGIFGLLGSQYLGKFQLAFLLAKITKPLSLLILQDRPLSTFLFGFFTVALPCGQTLVVFSACALTGNFYAGLINGFAFALLTSPSLFCAMKAHSFFGNRLRSFVSISHVFAILIGLLAICRGLAELEFFSHVKLVIPFADSFHLILF